MQNTKKSVIAVFVLSIFVIFSFALFFHPEMVDLTININALDSQEEKTTLINNLTDISEIQYKNEKIYVTDKIQNKLYTYDFNNTKEPIKNFGGNYDPQQENYTFNSLSHCATATNENIFLSDTDFGLKEYNSDFVWKTTHTRYILENSSYKQFKQIYGIQTSFSGETFLLEESVNGSTQIYIKSNSQDCFQQYKIFKKTISQNAKLLTTYNGNSIFILDNKQIHNVEGDLLLDLSTCDFQILDCKIDYNQNLYFLTEQNTMYKIKKYNFVESTYSYSKELELDENVSKFDFDYETGNLFIANKTTVWEIKVDNFFDNLNEYQHPVDWKLVTQLDSSVQIASVQKSAVAYKQPIEIVKIKSFDSENTKVIVLKKDVGENLEYTYILTSENNNFVAGYIKTQYLTFLIDKVEAPFDCGKIINNKTKIYKYPSTLVYSKDTNSNETTQIVVGELNLNDKVNIKNKAYNFVDSLGFAFYEIEYNEKIGYILQTTTINSEQIISKIVDAPNSQIKLSKNVSSINVFDENKNIIDTISNNRLIHKYEQDSNVDYSKISYLNNEDELIVGYVETKYISSLGISIYIILGIGSILLAIAIVLLAMFISIGKKKHKQDIQEKSNT